VFLPEGAAVTLRQARKVMSRWASGHWYRPLTWVRADARLWRAYVRPSSPKVRP
jgi:hypothetical protein